MTECARCNKTLTFSDGRLITAVRVDEFAVKVRCFICTECFKLMFSGINRWF